MPRALSSASLQYPPAPCWSATLPGSRCSRRRRSAAAPCDGTGSSARRAPRSGRASEKRCQKCFEILCIMRGMQVPLRSLGRNSIALKMAPKWNFEKGHMSQLKRVKSKKGLKMHPKKGPNVEILYNRHPGAQSSTSCVTQSCFFLPTCSCNNFRKHEIVELSSALPPCALRVETPEPRRDGFESPPPPPPPRPP